MTLLVSALLVAFAQAPKSPPSAFSLAAARAEAARKNNSPAAAELFVRALALNGAWKEGWWALGTIHYQHDRYAECRDAFARLAKLDPGSGPAWTMLGLCENGLQDYDPALAHLRTGQQFGAGIDAIDNVARYHLARLFTRSGDFESALGLLAAFAQAHKETPAYLMLGGTAALWKGVFPEDLPAEDRELVFLAGRAFWDAGARNAAAARQSFEALLAKYPRSPGVHYLFGSYQLLEHPERAIDEFEEELKISPNHAGALSAIAAEYLRRGEAAKGLPYARRFIEVLPDSLASHAILGRLLAETGDLAGAVRELEMARRLGPDDPQPHIALASVYAKLGRQQDAEAERREFLRLKDAGKSDVPDRRK